jgi:hypothetical protein
LSDSAVGRLMLALEILRDFLTNLRSLCESDDENDSHKIRQNSKLTRSTSEAADFSDMLLDFRIFAAQISFRQNCHCRNLDAELIDFIKKMKNCGI